MEGKKDIDTKTGVTGTGRLSEGGTTGKPAERGERYGKEYGKEERGKEYGKEERGKEYGKEERWGKEEHWDKEGRWRKEPYGREKPWEHEYMGERKFGDTLKEAKTVIGNLIGRAMGGAEKSAAEKLHCAWKSLADWSGTSYESSYRNYLQTALKYDEAKHALYGLSMAHLDAQCYQFCLAAKNMCEKKEMLKLWIETHKQRIDVDKSKCLDKDRTFIEAAQRFFDLAVAVCHSYQDAFDEGVRDYSFYLHKVDRCTERMKEFERMRDKLDKDVYMKHWKCLKDCKKDNVRKMITTKIHVEDLRRRILHFHDDFHESAVEVLEFLKRRLPELENLGRQHADKVAFRQCLDPLHRKGTQLRDMLEECLKCEKERVTKFQDKRHLERLVEERKKYFETDVSRTTTSRVGGDK